MVTKLTLLVMFTKSDMISLKNEMQMLI